MVLAASNVTLDFDEPIARGSLQIASNPNIGFDLPVFANSDQRILLHPLSVLSPLTSYTLTLSVTDLAGNVFSTTIGFTTAAVPDTQAPSLLTRTPGVNATNVPLNNLSVVATFSEPMNAASLVLTAIGSNIAFSDPVMSAGETIATWAMPTQGDGGLLLLSVFTSYTLSLSGADLAGNALPTATWSFTTQTVPDNTPPTLVTFRPAASSNNIPANTTFSFIFSEAMNVPSVESAMRLDGFTLPGAWSWAVGNRSAAFKPTANLVPQSHAVSLVNGAADTSGNLLAPFSSAFTSTAVIDTTAPVVAGTTPLANAQGVLIATSCSDRTPRAITMTFSEVMDRVSFEDALQVSVGGVTVAGVKSLSVNGFTGQFTPSAPLPNDVNVLVRVGGTGLPTATDLAGNLLSPFSFTFHTISLRTAIISVDLTKSGRALSAPSFGVNQVQVGVVAVGEFSASIQQRGFLGFLPASVLNTGSCLRTATFTIQQTGVNGTPFSGIPNLGAVFVEPVDTGDFDFTDYARTSYILPVQVSSSSPPGDRTVSVLNAARTIYSSIAPQNYRWRLQFSNVLSINPTIDFVTFAPNTASLSITHETP